MKMKQLEKLMKQAQQMQEQLASEQEEMRIRVTTGGGVVEVVMSGTKKLISIRIDPAAADPDDVEMLQDLILVAVNQASAQVDEQLGSRMSGLAGGLLG